MREVDRIDRVAALCITLCLVLAMAALGGLAWLIWRGGALEFALVILGALYGLKRLS